MIFRDYTTTGDGIITALQILRIMMDTGKPLSELKQCLSKYPQAQRNLKVARKPPLEELTEVGQLVRETDRHARRQRPGAAALFGDGAEGSPAHRGPRRGVDRAAGRQDRRCADARPSALEAARTTRGKISPAWLKMRTSSGGVGHVREVFERVLPGV